MENSFSIVLAYFNIIGGLVLGISNLVLYKKYNKRSVDWLKIVYAILGFYWFITYGILLFIDPALRLNFTSIFIRPSISIIITAILIDTFGKKSSIYLPDKIKEFIHKKRDKIYGN